MKTSLFDFHLPDSLIADRPATPRESAKMLVVNDGRLSDSTISQLPDFLRSGDVVVFNNSRVLPARLRVKRGDANIEILLHKSLGAGCWSAFAKPAKRLRVGDQVVCPGGLQLQVHEKLETGEVVLGFPIQGNTLFDYLQQYGEMPLPPYISRKRHADASDKSTYQTIYAVADKTGSVAAPTAGLHFTPALMENIRKQGAECVFVTLHVGGGTFLPVKVEDTTAHMMHSEFAELTAATAAAINQARQRGGRVIAVGTTALRVLESAADEAGTLHPIARETDIFITPGYSFRAVDILLTNFHLPRSTLFMLVSAFAGLEQMKATYAHATRQRYRFYSYGDACLLFRQRESGISDQV